METNAKEKNFKILQKNGKIELHFRINIPHSFAMSISRVDGVDYYSVTDMSRYNMLIWKGELFTYEEVISNIKAFLKEEGYQEVE